MGKILYVSCELYNSVALTRCVKCLSVDSSCSLHTADTTIRIVDSSKKLQMAMPVAQAALLVQRVQNIALEELCMYYEKRKDCVYISAL